MPRSRQPASTGRLHCEGFCSTRRISTTGARQIWVPSSNHYDTLFGLNLTAAQKVDLVEYLKSL